MPTAPVQGDIEFGRHIHKDGVGLRGMQELKAGDTANGAAKALGYVGRSEST